MWAALSAAQGPHELSPEKLRPGFCSMAKFLEMGDQWGQVCVAKALGVTPTERDENEQIRGPITELSGAELGSPPAQRTPWRSDHAFVHSFVAQGQRRSVVPSV
ncbi:unnamed protein product [Lampetra fluviatilis]